MKSLRALRMHSNAERNAKNLQKDVDASKIEIALGQAARMTLFDRVGLSRRASGETYASGAEDAIYDGAAMHSFLGAA